ncbi:hypothetical protein [Spirosoma panaciterrae]|nr:hypothetical protein [Spirosoma panaciterrae]
MSPSQPEPQPGDYYGVIYKGSLLWPLILLIALGVGIWLLIRRRRK